MDKNDKNSMALLAIVAIVAVVGLIILFNGNITGKASDNAAWKRDAYAAVNEIEVIDYESQNCPADEWCEEELLFSKTYTETPLCEVFRFESNSWEQEYICKLNADAIGVLVDVMKGMPIKVLVFE
ncbi:hypothetical protein HQ529_02415 [Candidatus Woesearchaeota archaeon]|nr:hypothetical protein [Candidatus Woesearchaeota archaeon]